MTFSEWDDRFYRPNWTNIWNYTDEWRRNNIIMNNEIINMDMVATNLAAVNKIFAPKLPIPFDTWHGLDGLISRVIFNDPATIVYWKDGTKTVVKCGEGDTFDKEKGLAMAICKYITGNRGNFNTFFDKYIEE